MEEQLQEYLQNHTAVEETLILSIPRYVYNILYLLSWIMAIIAAILIITVIARTAKLRTWTNIVILNWTISNLLYLLCYPALYFFFESDMVFLLFANCFMCILITDALAESKRITIQMLIIAIYGLELIVLVTGVMLDISGLRFYKILLFFYTSSLIYILVAVIVKQVHKCRVRNSGGIKKSANIRLVLATVFISNWVVVFACTFCSLYIMTYFFYDIVFVMIHLSSVFILTTLYKIDISFKICLLKLFRCNVGEYSADDAISIAEDSECGDAVSVNVERNVSST